MLLIKVAVSLNMELEKLKIDETLYLRIWMFKTSFDLNIISPLELLTPVFKSPERMASIGILTAVAPPRYFPSFKNSKEDT